MSSLVPFHSDILNFEAEERTISHKYNHLEGYSLVTHPYSMSVPSVLLFKVLSLLINYFVFIREYFLQKIHDADK